MECIPANPVFEFRPDQLESVRKEYSLEKPSDMARAVDVLEEWVKVQKHFTKKELPRNYLEKSILAGKGSLERAKQRLDKICTFRTLMPEFFENDPVKNTFGNAHAFPGEPVYKQNIRFLSVNNTSMTPPILQMSMGGGDYLPSDDSSARLSIIYNIYIFKGILSQSILLPKPTNEHHRVYLLKVTGSTFAYHLFMECYISIVMLCEYVMGYDYSDGFIVVIDYTEANLIEVVKALTLTELHKILTIITEGFGMRLKEIHIVTSSKAVNTLVTIFKQLVSPKLGRRISVHNDTSTLCKSIPKDILPVEYGGMEKSFKVLHDRFKHEITGEEFRNYFKQMNDAKTDESCRDRDKFNEQYLGVSGSFRTLNVD